MGVRINVAVAVGVLLASSVKVGVSVTVAVGVRVMVVGLGVGVAEPLWAIGAVELAQAGSMLSVAEVSPSVTGWLLLEASAVTCPVPSSKW